MKTKKPDSVLIEKTLKWFDDKLEKTCSPFPAVDWDAYKTSKMQVKRLLKQLEKNK